MEFNRRYIFISILSGALALGFAPLGIELLWENIHIDLPWSIVFPILVSIVLGWKYGLISALSGGAWFPFLLWQNNGFPNISTFLVYTLIYVLMGAANSPFLIKRYKYQTVRVFFMLFVSVFLLMIYYRFVFNWILKFNPLFGLTNSMIKIDKEVLFGFFYKDSINFFSATIISLVLAKLPFINGLFGLPILAQSRGNHRIFFYTLLVFIGIWLSFVGLVKTLLKPENMLLYEHIVLALFTILSAGFAVMRILIHFRENEFLTLAKLNESENIFRKSIEFSPLPVILSNSQNRFVFLNKQFVESFGYTLSDIPTITDWFLKAYPNEKYRKEVVKEWEILVENAKIMHEPIFGKEYTIFCKNGEFKSVEISAFYEKDISIGLFHDITYRKKNENELIKAKERAVESDKLKTAFLNNLSHEIRTPMNAIIGFSNFLSEPDLETDKKTSFVKIIQTSSKQLLSIVNNILTVSALETKQERLRLTKVNINTILTDLFYAFNEQETNKKIKFTLYLALEKTEAHILTDSSKLTQIVHSLVSNAFKFTAKGSIEMGYHLKKETNQLIFYVKDSGIGIEKEQFQTIFEHFRQADLSLIKKYGGTGLGLSIAKGFVQMLGGNIWLESNFGAGSTFYFSVPYTVLNQNNTLLMTPKNEKKQRTVLVAEDEDFNFLYIEELLKSYDIEIIRTKNGLETIEKCKELDDIYLILMDIKMPFMDGYKAAQIIKQIRPKLPIIAQSAYAMEHEIEKYSNAFDDYITKPIDIQIFKEKLSHYF